MKFFLFFCFFCCLLSTKSFSQEFIYEYFSLENGLPQSQMLGSAMCLDDKGMIWAGTNGGGLAVLHGDKFKVYRESDGLPNNQIWALTFYDKKIWYACPNGGGIGYFDGKKFQAVSDTGKTLGINIGLNGKFMTDSQNNLWYQTANALYILQNGQFFNVKSRKDLQNEIIFNIANDLKKNIILSTNNGIFELKNGLFLKRNISFPENIQNFTPVFFSEDTSGTEYYGFFDPANPQAFRRFFKKKNTLWEEIILPVPLNEAVLNIYKAKNGDLWILTVLNIVQFTDGKIYYHNQKSGLASLSLTMLLEDEKEVIWIATQGRGVLKMPKIYCENYSVGSGANRDSFFGLYQDKQGRIWAGGSRGGIYRFENGNLTLQNFQSVANLQRVTGFLEYENEFFVCSFTGLYRLRGDVLEPYSAKFGFPQGQGVQSLKREEDWIWAATNVGAYALNLKTGEQKNIRLPGNLQQVNIVRDILPDGKGNYWLTLQQGLHFAAANQKDSKTYVRGKGFPEDALGLHGFYDSKKVLRVVTYSTGLFCYDGKDFRHYTQKDGLSNDLVYSAAEDKNGNIWVGTQKGVDKVRFDENGKMSLIRHYDHKIGFKGTEMNGRSAFCDREGNIWFGHLEGIGKFLNKEIKQEAPPKTYIEKILVNLKEFNPKVERDNFSDLSAWFDLPENLVLPHDRSDLIFKFFALEQNGKQEVRFQWKLDGLQADWQAGTERNEAVFTNLPPGKYTFWVRSLGESGQAGEQTSFSFQILPSIYQTWWFRSLFVALIILLIYAFIRYRINLAEAQKRVLEEIVKKRTAEISAQRDEILQKNTELQQQKEEILAQQEELSQKTADIEIAYAEISEHSKNIQSSIAYAQRIQAVMLPREHDLARAFDDYFVLYKPRDVVSGDFYWFASYEERVIFAVFDCTGHGVPGAFMSMAGEAYLNMIINVQHCFSAGKILTELHNSITQSLKQSDSENRDGMDAAMCILNMKENTLEFAGAKNPLVTVREGEMTLYKSDSMSVGGRVKEGKKHEFSSTIIPLTPKTWYYMYSDGYQDQFGSTEKRKFMSQNFRELLRKNSKEIGETQKQILEDTFQKWIHEGNETQIDDVTVVGFYFD